MEGQPAAVCRRRLCGLVAVGAVVCRRTVEACPRAFGHHCPGHQLVQTPGAWLRSAGEPGIFEAQPIGRGAHSDVLGESEVKTPRVPAAGPLLQSLSGVFGDAHGGARDGIKNKIDPGQPLDKDIFDLEAGEAASIPSMPGSLGRGPRGKLEKDHKFLTEGGVFSEDYVELWIAYKRKNEADAVRMRPHPYEFLFVLRHLACRVRRERPIVAVRGVGRLTRRGEFLDAQARPLSGSRSTPALLTTRIENVRQRQKLPG